VVHPIRKPYFYMCTNRPRHLTRTWITVFFVPLLAVQEDPWPLPAVQEDPWWMSVMAPHFKQTFADDWTNTSFASRLSMSTADYVLVDFYAPWCPHCVHFHPEFERLSYAIRELNGKVATQDTDPTVAASTKVTILPAVVDCTRALEMCKFFGIDAYPVLKWGKRDDWLETTCFREPANRKKSECKDSVNKLETVAVGLSAETVAEWIQNRTSANLKPSLSDEEFDRRFNKDWNAAASRDAGSSSPLKADLWDAQLGVAFWLREIFERYGFMPSLRQEVRAMTKSPEENETTFMVNYAPFTNLTDFVDVLTRNFPDVKAGAPCHKSLVALQGRLSALESKSAPKNFTVDADALEKDWKLCGTEWSTYSAGWRSCKGTKPGNRGFSCGLWNIVHMLAAKSTDGTALKDLHAMRNTIISFFACESCREHFAKMPLPKTPTLSRKEAQLWWWRTHNLVNKRVKRIEDKAKDWDPGFPKVQWPSKEQCPACRSQNPPVPLAKLPVPQRTARLRGQAVLAADEGYRVVQEGGAKEYWNLDAVSRFLDNFYSSLGS